MWNQPWKWINQSLHASSFFLPRLCVLLAPTTSRRTQSRPCINSRTSPAALTHFIVWFKRWYLNHPWNGLVIMSVIIFSQTANSWWLKVRCQGESSPDNSSCYQIRKDFHIRQTKSHYIRWKNGRAVGRPWDFTRSTFVLFPNLIIY